MNLNEFLSEMKIEILPIKTQFTDTDLDMFGGEFVGQTSPVFRWVGGKTQLLSALRFYSPKSFGAYYEPFVGGGALLFSLMPKCPTINDVNPVIINLYRDIKDNYNDLIWVLQALTKLPDTETVYLAIRDIYNSHIRNNELTVDVSGMFFYLNAKCFNGLYRVNSKGEFNVGYAKDSVRPYIYQVDTLKFVHDYFNSTDITIFCGDYRKCLETVQPGDFVYLDPPYAVISDTKGFTAYAQDGFDEKAQIELAEEFRRLSDLGVYVMQSNSDADLIRDLYSDYKIKELNVNYYIQPHSSDIRRSELLIMNY